MVMKKAREGIQFLRGVFQFNPVFYTVLVKFSCLNKCFNDFVLIVLYFIGISLFVS